MSSELRRTFEVCKKEGRKAMIAFLTAGFPTVDSTVPLMLALQAGGCDIVELGMPFTDPIADGPVIQHANHVALENNVSLDVIFDLIRKARESGFKLPILLMGYYNPIMHYGEEKVVKNAREAGANGFLICDLPPEEAVRFRTVCAVEDMSYVPLVAPNTTPERLETLARIANSFIYVVSRMGSTGATGHLSDSIGELVLKIRKYTKDVPLAVGFGISTREHFLTVSKVADGVIIGSYLLSVIQNAEPNERCEKARQYISDVVGGRTVRLPEYPGDMPPAVYANDPLSCKFIDPVADKLDRFGQFGGQYVPEVLHRCLKELEATFKEARDDPKFWEEFRSFYSYIGRPSSLHVAERLTERMGGARIWLKREDLNHTGSHKINNALGQCLIAKRMGKSHVIAETGAGQHGVATATAAAKFGFRCTVYMGAKDAKRQALNVFRMKLLGAKVIEVTSGTQSLRDACTEALRQWVTQLDDTHYILGTATGPHPFPIMVRTFQSVIGRETREQMESAIHRLPTAVVCCVGGGSNCAGMFSEFIPHKEVRLIGVEAGGSGIESGKHAASLTGGSPGILHGAKTFVLQNSTGQILDTHSISAGLDYPGVGPELSFWKETGRAEFVPCTDLDALRGFRLLSETEGIMPALESSHAVMKAAELAATLKKSDEVVICVSGRGDKDVKTIASSLPVLGPQMGWDIRFEQ